MYDVVIVGAGIAGASLAWRLAPCARVLVLEREAQPGHHSTGRSAAMFMETYGAPMVRALTRASRDFYERPPAGFCDGPLLAPRGCLYVADATQSAELAALHAELAAEADGVSLIGRDEACARVPVLRPERVIGAVDEPDARDIDVALLHQAFLRGLRRQGGELRTRATVRQALHEAGGWTVTLAEGGSVRGRVLVNAAGAWADQLAGACGVAPVGLQPRRRSAFTFAAPAGVDARAWPSVVGVDESFYFKPDAGQLLGSPANADPVEPHDVVPEELDIALGIDRIQSFTTMQIRRPSRVWAGLRSFVDDGELVIGADPAQPAFFWLAAQGGYGIQTAAGASALATGLLLGEALPAELEREGVDAVRVSPARLR